MPVVYLILSLIAIVIAVAIFIARYRVSGKYFDSAGVKIHYTDEGAGVPIVLVHGFGVQADINWRWNGCIRKLKKNGYRVIALDVRGHGRSGHPTNPEAYGAELCDDVIRLMDHLGIDKAHLAGYSMGGFITLKTIERHPDRLLSGTICAAGWSELSPEIRALFEAIVGAMEQRREFNPITDWLEPSKRAHPIQHAVVNWFMNRTNDVPAIVNVFRTFEQLAVPEEALRTNQVPALTLVGSRDGIREQSDLLPGRMANHQLIYIPNGDHLTTAIHPLFMRSMLEFLAANTPNEQAAVAAEPEAARA